MKQNLFGIVFYGQEKKSACECNAKGTAKSSCMQQASLDHNVLKIRLCAHQDSGANSNFNNFFDNVMTAHEIPSEVVLDLSDFGKLPSELVASCLDVSRKVQAKGGTFKLKGLSIQAKQVLFDMWVDKQFTLVNYPIRLRD